MLSVCDDDHDELCYSGKDCPGCALRKEIVSGEEIISDLNDKISQLEDDLSVTQDNLARALSENIDLQKKLEE